ncbi:FtsX-like permease family protein [Polymorphobacter sp.]|uniref:FtsX-like permease family protein n=1 Tax=Polymorphobacter sp. TaxID=1909290 RepID=UPI003F6E546C
MSFFGLSFAYLRDRGLNTLLNILLLALAVATLVILLLFARQMEDRFTRDAQGIDLVVGAKGSPLQLILSSIYHADVPTGNIPLDSVDTLRRERTVAKVIPLALGDNFRGYRIVGSERAYPEHYGATLAEGRYWDKTSEVVIGSEVARGLGMAMGQRFVGSHGLSDDDRASGHDHAPFMVVGRLAPTGTVIDRLILTSVESVWDVHGIAHDEGDHDHDHDGEADHAAADHDHGEEAACDTGVPHDHDCDGKPDHGPGAEAAHAGEDHEAHVGHGDAQAEGASARPHAMQAEVTALLVTYASPLAAIQLPSFINRQTNMQAAVPAVEISRLLSLVGLGLDAVRALALLLLLTAGLSIFVALYTALRQREGDMAMLRVIGASRASIFGQILFEGVALAAAGALLGVALGHAVIGLAAANIRQLAELGLDAAHFEMAEVWIVLGALAIGALAALLPALRVFRADIADTLANSR